jgi:hypothetical protein
VRSAPETGSEPRSLFGLIGAVLGGGLGVLIAMGGDERAIFIASDQPITTAQVEEKLRIEGKTCR